MSIPEVKSAMLEILTSVADTLTNRMPTVEYEQRNLFITVRTFTGQRMGDLSVAVVSRKGMSLSIVGTGCTPVLIIKSKACPHQHHSLLALLISSRLGEMLINY